MLNSSLSRVVGRIALGLALVATVGTVGLNALCAAPPKADPATKVDLFDAINSGTLDAKMVVKNSREATLLLHNRSANVLSVQLPDAFGASPILAQTTTTPRTSSSSSSSSNSGNQSVGSSGSSSGSSGGFFSIPPEKTTNVKVPCVCLEHGKKEPSPVVKYELQPIDKLANDPAVRDLLPMLASGKVSQRVVQAAAWHLNNNMTWQQLADKKVNRLGWPDTPYFSAEELQRAQSAVSMAQSLASQRKQEEKPKTPEVRQGENPEVRVQ